MRAIRTKRKRKKKGIDKEERGRSGVAREARGKSSGG